MPYAYGTGTYVHIIRVWYGIILCHTSICSNRNKYIIGASPILAAGSLSEPHTSGKNGMSEGTSVAFAKIYVEIRINGTSIMRSQKFTIKNRVIIYKCDWHIWYFANYPFEIFNPL